MTTRTLVRAGGFTLALLGGLSLPLSAQGTLDAEVTPFVGGRFYVGDATVPLVSATGGGSQVRVHEGRLESAPTVGLRAGLRFADRFGVEASVGHTGARVKNQGRTTPIVDASTLRLGLEVLYHMLPGAVVQPFAGVGVAHATTDYDPDLTPDDGAEWAGSVTLGGSIPVTEAVSLRLQAVQDVLRTESPRENPTTMVVGLSFRQPIR